MASLQNVLDLLEQNQLPAALETCQQLVNINPTDAQAQHLLGIIYAKLGKLTQAIECFSAAIKIDPQQVTYLNSISNAYKLLGNIELAVRHLHHALRLDPNNAQSFNNLGSLYYTQGNFKEAMPQFEKAIRLNPNIWEAHYNLANCYIKEDKLMLAISHYQTVLKLNPAHENAKVNLAMSFVSENDYENALPLLEEIAPKNPQHAELQAHLANAYLELGKPQEAITQFNKALALTPDRGEWQHNLAVLYLRDQKPELAKQHFIKAIELQPDNQIAKHMLDSLNNTSGAAHADTAPAEYVSSLFDQYAGYYNEHVTKDLHYNVPALLRQTYSKFLSGFSRQQYVLDLGCGTGLCGIYFRDVARFLVGVDISPAMLEQARLLGAYDSLVCCNILEALPGLNQSYFDLVIAADVIVYIGNLEPLFAMFATTLKHNGVMMFTIEEQTENNTFLLQTTGRYAHSQQYIGELCIRYNFTIEVNEAITPRTQHDKPIAGRLYTISLV